MQRVLFVIILLTGGSVGPCGWDMVEHPFLIVKVRATHEYDASELGLGLFGLWVIVGFTV